jgi:hypothetical protein
MNRRGFVSALLAAPLLAWAGDLLAKTAQFPNQPTQPSQFPGGYPPRTEPMPPTPKLDPHAVLVENQKKIKKDVKQLYKLAGKLRKQVNGTDSSEILSLDMINTAEKIEKLAKHIRDLARG